MRFTTMKITPNSVQTDDFCVRDLGSNHNGLLRLFAELEAVLRVALDNDKISIRYMNIPDKVHNPRGEFGFVDVLKASK
jgi:hypothetical protein